MVGSKNKENFPLIYLFNNHVYSHASCKVGNLIQIVSRFKLSNFKRLNNVGNRTSVLGAILDVSSSEKEKEKEKSY